MDFKNLINSIFTYTPEIKYEFDILEDKNDTQNYDSKTDLAPPKPSNIYESLDVNLEYIKTKYMIF